MPNINLENKNSRENNFVIETLIVLQNQVYNPLFQTFFDNEQAPDFRQPSFLDQDIINKNLDSKTSLNTTFGKVAMSKVGSNQTT